MTAIQERIVMDKKHTWHLPPRRLFQGVIALLVCWVCPAFGTTRLYSYPPRVTHVDVEKYLLIIVSEAGFYAQDMDTGKRLWSHPWPSEARDSWNLQCGNTHLLITIGNGIQVMDKFTGRNRWTRRNEELGRLYFASFIGNGAWVQARFERGTVVYTGAGKAVPMLFAGKRLEEVSVSGWLPDGKTLLLTQRGTTEDTRNTLTTYFWDTETDNITKGYVLKADGSLLLYYLPDSEKAYLIEINSGGHRGHSAFKEIDVYTGTIRRAGEMPKPWSGFTEDGHVLTLSVELDKASLVSLETGETVATIGGPGHLFIIHTTVLARGKNWMFSRDDTYRYWLWSFEEDASPRMIWEPPPGNYLPGPIEAVKPPYMLCQTGPNKMEAFLIDNLERVKSWRAEGEPRRVFTAVTCADMNRILAWFYEDDAETGESVWKTQVFEAHNPTPLITVPGVSQGLSPDGRFCATQHPRTEGPVYLVNVDSGKTLAVIDHEKMGSATVVFSPDSRFVAVLASEETTFLSLDNERVRRTVKRRAHLIFSPDGNYYVTQWGYGRATVYESSTGEAVHTFEEQEKVAARHSRPPRNILERAENFGRNLLGRVVTVAPATPMLTCGFAADGTQLITLAEGQILRVWDICSGKLLRTIRTRLPEQRDARGQINNHLVLSPNGAYAFAYNSDGFAVATLWETATGRAIIRHNLPAAKVKDIAVLDDGTGVYMSLEDGLYFLAGKKR